MARALLNSEETAASVARNVARFYLMGSGGAFSTVATEDATVSVTFRQTGSFDGLAVYVSANTADANRTFTTRKNATSDGSLSATITSTTTGWFYDLTNSDTVTAGDEWGYHMNVATGATAGSTTVQTASVNYSVAGKAVTRTVVGITGVVGDTLYRELAGDGISGVDTTENNTEYTTKESCSLSNGLYNVFANTADTDGTLRSRVDGANGNITMTITANTTGIFEDTSNSDSVASGQTINWQFVVGTGTGSTQGLASLDYNSTAGNALAMHGRDTTTSAGDEFYQPGGGVASITEANEQASMTYTATAKNLQMNLYANTLDTNSAGTSRKNTAPGSMSVTIVASTTGLLVDDVNTDSLVSGDEYGYMVDESAGAGTATIGQFSSLLLDGTQSATSSRNFGTLGVGT